MPEWPAGWRYQIVLSPHLIERMNDRGFSEVDLRTMLEDEADYRPSVAPGRFLVEAAHDHEAWEVVVEPDDLTQVLVVATAYAIE